MPRAVAPEAPLLHAGCGQRRGGRDVPVDCGSNECSVAFIANVQRVRIGKPDSKGKRNRS